MLKRVVHSLGLVGQHTDHKDDPRRKSKVRGTSKKDFVVRIVHEGGEVEVYPHAISASKLMAKYPGMCVAKPEIFTVPHQSVLWPQDHLLLGHKYIIISNGKVEKLKRKYAQQGKTKEVSRVVTQETLEARTTKSPWEHKSKENCKISVGNEVASQEMMDKRITLSPNGCKIQENYMVKEEKVNAKMNHVQEYFCSAKDFSVPKEKITRYSRRKGIKGKKPFVPPLPKARSYRGLGWQPSLPTVQEISA